jgi:hypothetical protein
MKLDDFRNMRQLGERKLSGESNLRDMSEVHVRELEQGGARYQLDEKNRRFRKIEGSHIGAWEKLER